MVAARTLEADRLFYKAQSQKSIHSQGRQQNNSTYSSPTGCRHRRLKQRMSTRTATPTRSTKRQRHPHPHIRTDDHPQCLFQRLPEHHHDRSAVRAGRRQRSGLPPRLAQHCPAHPAQPDRRCRTRPVPRRRTRDERHRHTDQPAPRATPAALHLQRRPGPVAARRPDGHRPVDRSVLAGKRRAHYAHAARLATALTEAEILTEGNGNYLDGICDTYRRYTAFRRETEAARRSSTLL